MVAEVQVWGMLDIAIFFDHYVVRVGKENALSLVGYSNAPLQVNETMDPNIGITQMTIFNF